MNVNSRSSQSRRHSRKRGAILPWVLALGAATGLGIFAIYSYLPSLAKEQGKNKEMLRMKLALSSAVDFIRNGVENQICFNDVWMEDASCTLVSDPNNRSSQRLLLMPESLAFLKQRVSNNITALKEIQGELMFSKLSMITANHPLKIVSAGLTNKSGIEGFKIRIRRLAGTLGEFPSAGQEVQVQIRVELIMSNLFERAWLTRDAYYAQSTVVLFPRELASFSLIVPGRLRLDAVGTASTETGFAPSADGDSWSGITFASPVFVNRDLVLPRPELDLYTPVKFDGAVVLGGGRLQIPKAPGSDAMNLFSPATGGGMEDRYFGQQKNFGGFSKGVRIEGSPDLGLDCLFANAGSGFATACPAAPAGSPSASDLTQLLATRDFCLDQMNAMTDLRATRNSELALRARNVDRSGDRLKFDLMLGATGKNRLVTPNNRSVKNASTATGSGVAILSGGTYNAASDRASAQLTLRHRDTIVRNFLKDMDLVIGQRVEVELPSRDAGKVASYENNVKNAAQTLKTAQDALKAAQDALIGIPPTDLSYPVKQGAVTLAEGAVTAAQNALNAHQTQLANAQKKTRLEIELKAVPIEADNTATRQPHVMALEFNVADGRSVLEEWGLDKLELSLKTWELGDDNSGESLRDASGWSSDPNNTALAAGRSFTQALRLGNLPTSNWTSIRQGSFGAPTVVTNHQIPYDGRDLLADAYFGTNVGRDLRDRCESGPGVGASAPLSLSSGGTLSFPNQARNSWHFAPVNEDSPEAPFGRDLVIAADSNSFEAFSVRSAVNTCRIASNVTFVAGMLVCDTFEIAQRTTPLKIVGTVIARKIDIHDTALRHGIWWASIYHPQGLAELRAAGVLSSPAECRSSTRARAGRIPIWHPQPSIENISKDRRCFAAALRDKAEPFTWTRVDPDCFLESGSIVMTCKKDYRNFVFKELIREESL